MSSTLQKIVITVGVGPSVLYDLDENYKPVAREPEDWREWFDLLKGVYTDMAVSVDSPKDGVIVLTCTGEYINEHLVMMRFNDFLQKVQGIPIRTVNVTSY